MARTRAGFTLIELLIVVVVIAILAALAIPKFQNTKGKANAAAIKSDLRNLATAEEAYFYENGTYTSNLALLKFTMSPGMQVLGLQANGGGWTARFTHPLAWPMTCAVYFGGIAPLPPAVSEGNIACN